MPSYRYKRRTFLAALGGAFGLRTMMRNMEASAQGTPPPPRFLMTHWPVGTVHYHFRPQGTGTSYVPSRILQPIEDAGLRENTIILYGMNHNGLQGGPGGHEAGTPFMSTGAHSPGNRENGGEPDDACAGGPSFDQIFLENIPELQTSGFGYINAICDKRIDSQETSTRCLSYGYTKVSVQSAGGGNIMENTPNHPELSPALVWEQLFGDFSMDDMDPTDRLKELQLRKSVLDHSLDELARMRTLVPSSEWARIDAHAEIVRKIEEQVASQIETGGGTTEGCAIPMQPDGSLVGGSGDGVTGYSPDYNNPNTNVDDSELHSQIGILHSSVIRAAFQCDIIRVATFQWSPGTNHVSFGPDAAQALPASLNQDTMYPGSTQTYMHHPLSHRIVDQAEVLDAPGANADVAEFLANVQTWYNVKTAEIINGFKEASDVNGANLLDYTIIPYVTEVAHTTHHRSPLQAMIFGGAGLGMQGGQYVEATNRHLNDMWVTLAQAYMKTTDNPATQAIFQDAGTYTNGVSPIDGLYVPV